MNSDFDTVNTKILGLTASFDLNDPSERQKYFKAKVGREIEQIKSYLDNSTFVAFLLAKKGAGKGTFSKMFQEIIGINRVATISIGDLVRETGERIKDASEYEKLKKYLEKNYRGFISIEDALNAFQSRTQSSLIPTEFILSLIQQKLEGDVKDKAVFIDGFPRGADQISYALYFRQIMRMRDDPDFIVTINVPEKVIEDRIKSRLICPICQTSRNKILLPTKLIGYDDRDKFFYLICDNRDCTGYKKQRLVPKQGDDLGIEPIKTRLKSDGELVEMALKLHGIPLVKLNNAIPIENYTNVDPYEVTKEYFYELGKNKEVISKSKEYIVKDDNGRPVYSLLAATVMVDMIRQVSSILSPGTT